MGGSGWCEHEPALFVIVSTHAGREIAVPAASARAAQQAARYLLEHYSHIRPTWQANPDATLGPVVVFGCRRPLAGEHLLDQQAHAFILAAGTPLPPVWAALCGHQVEATVFDALDDGMGRPCQACRQRWAAGHEPAEPVELPAKSANPTRRGG